jgi:hypothetical protein
LRFSLVFEAVECYYLFNSKSKRELRVFHKGLFFGERTDWPLCEIPGAAEEIKMNRNILFITLTAGILSAMCRKATFGDVSANEQNTDVKITITKFHMNDQTVELNWKIANNTDHDVWICDSVSVFTGPDFEVYLSEDEQSLLIRRRLDVPTAWVWGQCPYGRYVLLRSGQERTESVSLAVPVTPRLMFAGGLTTSDHARRLVLEIGFYNEDLPGMIRDILEMADKLNCARLELKECSTAFFMRYFKGIWIAHWLFGGLSQFEEYTYKEGSEEIEIPYTWQKFNGEQVLRATVDGVSIAYGEVPVSNEPTQSETEPAGVTMALTSFDVNDTILELSYKIKNNSDHDVWICDGLATGLFECVLDKDNETLKIIKRSSLPQGPGWEHWPWVKFIRLRPGQEKEDPISLTVPVRPYTEFSHQRGNAEYARRVAIEIGFYDEDLRGLILNIVDLTERLNCDISVLNSIVAPESQIIKRFFAGVDIAQVFHDESFGGFRDKVLSDGDEISMPYMDQFLHGEQVLRIEIDGMSIPYKSSYPPLND